VLREKLRLIREHPQSVEEEGHFLALIAASRRQSRLHGPRNRVAYGFRFGQPRMHNRVKLRRDEGPAFWNETCEERSARVAFIAGWHGPFRPPLAAILAPAFVVELSAAGATP